MAIADGASYTAAAHQVGRRHTETISAWVSRFNRDGLAAVRPGHGGGARIRYGADAQQRILTEWARTPQRDQDGTATWSLSLLQRALRRAPDRLPKVSTTIWGTLHAAGLNYLHWSVFRHADVVHVLKDHETFSNAVSTHLSVPNGMDPPEHGKYRTIVERYFEPQRMQAFEPVCRSIAAELARQLPSEHAVDLMGEFAENFAVQIQCAFMGWPEALHAPLRLWVRKNHEATLAGHQAATAAVALEFDHHIRAQLEVRREVGTEAPDDVTTSLLRERIDGRSLSDEEIVSIVRNWTVGELGTIAASIGILVHYLAERLPLQRELREKPSLLPAAIDETLRIHAPLIANRRVTTRAVEIGGRALEAGARLGLIWASANRDETVFGDPDEFRLDRDPSDNLLYGAGIHICPGAPLARLELRIVLEELFKGSREITLADGKPAIRARYPASGFSRLPVRIS